MAQRYIIYINDQSLFVGTNPESVIYNSLFIVNEHDVTSVLADVVTGKLQSSLYLESSDPDKTFKNICKKLNFIEAAGGLVRNELDEYLFIFRLGKWDLPKGKLEKGEEIAECAVREVEEECGVKVERLIQELPSTYHTYMHKGELTLKRTYWFSMECKGNPDLTPQTEEDISEVRWVKREDFEMIYENTYPSIIDVLKNLENN